MVTFGELPEGGEAVSCGARQLVKSSAGETSAARPMAGYGCCAQDQQGRGNAVGWGPAQKALLADRKVDFSSDVGTPWGDSIPEGQTSLDRQVHSDCYMASGWRGK